MLLCSRCDRRVLSTIPRSPSPSPCSAPSLLLIDFDFFFGGLSFSGTVRFKKTGSVSAKVEGRERQQWLPASSTRRSTKTTALSTGAALDVLAPLCLAGFPPDLGFSSCFVYRRAWRGSTGTSCWAASRAPDLLCPFRLPVQLECDMCAVGKHEIFWP